MGVPEAHARLRSGLLMWNAQGRPEHQKSSVWTNLKADAQSLQHLGLDLAALLARDLLDFVVGEGEAQTLVPARLVFGG